MQVDSEERGFSFRRTALDMRMDMRKETTAADLVNNLEAGELVRILREYGEEKWAKRIVSAIVRERNKEAITTTLRLADIVCSAIPHTYRPDRIHPATRTFQALRITVNRELDLIDKAIKDAISHLKRGCRICVISFHSLEDRIVKQTFRTIEKGCICPPRIPYCVCGLKKEITVLTRKPIRPSATEIISNPRSRSARLRVAEEFNFTYIWTLQDLSSNTANFKPEAYSAFSSQNPYCTICCHARLCSTACVCHGL